MYLSIYHIKLNIMKTKCLLSGFLILSILVSTSVYSQGDDAISFKVVKAMQYDSPDDNLPDMKKVDAVITLNENTRRLIIKGSVNETYKLGELNYNEQRGNDYDSKGSLTDTTISGFGSLTGSTETRTIVYTLRLYDSEEILIMLMIGLEKSAHVMAYFGDEVNFL